MNVSLTQTASVDLSFEPGSFRDRSARVLRSPSGKIYRLLDKDASEAWRKLRGTRFFQQETARGRIVRTSDAAPGSVNLAGWEAALEHETIPFISYAYEWCFGMLKDAALLHLDLLEAALHEGMCIKDSTHFNIQWRGTAPTFIDIPSFEPYTAGQPWIGYRQFCEMFLFPLLLQAQRGLQFQPLLRGTLDGVPVQEMARIVSLRDLLRPGVFKHVWLQDKFQQKFTHKPVNAQQSLRQAGFHKELILANTRGLRKLIAGLKLPTGRSTWSEYTQTHSYSSDDMLAKQQAVERIVSSCPRGMVWDLGSNTGTFSEIAAKHSDYVVAVDSDPLAIERLYARLKGSTKILPLIMNLADPSPRLGFANAERKLFGERGKPSLILALALIHHVVIGANVPLERFVDWLAEHEADLILEFVSKEDEMSQVLLHNKKDNYADYSQANLEQALSRAFHIDARIPLKGGKRILYSCKYRATTRGPC